VPWILTDTTATGEGVEPDPAGVVWQLDVQNREIDADVTSLSAGQDTGMHVGPEFDALIHVLSGSAALTTELDTIELAAGALLWMPKRSRRQFVAGSDGLRYLTIHQKRQFLSLMATG
jgi:quercetin dioxygenase-like cupin family protein